MSDTSVLDELNIQKIQEEIEAIRVSRRKDEAELEGFHLRNQIAQKEVKNSMASADLARTYTFWGKVDSPNVASTIYELDVWSRRDPKQDITILFNSPGGDVFSGLALYDFIKELKSRGHTITTKSFGMAASMGGILLQGGDTRIMAPNSFMLIHEISSVFGGKTSDLEDDLAFSKQLQSKCLAILSERSTLTAKQIATQWKKKDWWLDANKALELGFIDKIEG